MKKNMIALAVAAAVAAPAAMADTTIYGKLNLNINATDGKDASVNSTASRIGFKGSKDLDNGLKAIYKIEFGLESIADAQKDSYTAGSFDETDATVDSGDYTAGSFSEGKGILSQRNAYLGLAGSFGTVLMGRHDTPFKMSQPSDLFNDGAADLGKMSGAVAESGGEVRSDNVLAYISPSFNGVKVIAASVMDATDGSDDAMSVAVTYGSTKDGIYAAAAFNQGGAYDNNEEMRLSAQYKANGLIANIMHQTDDGNDGKNTQINVGYKMGKFMPKLKYSMVDDGTIDDSGMAYGVNYSLGNKTTAYIYAVDAEDIGVTDATIAGIVTKF